MNILSDETGVHPSPQPAAGTTAEGEGIVLQCQVTVHDVLLGRGRGPNMHPGNQRYREIIYANRDNYNKASNRTEQTRITREIVNHIKQNGRFLKRLEAPKGGKKKKKRGESSGDIWVVVGDATARLKVGQCLRYKLRQDAEQQEDGTFDGFQGEERSAASKDHYSGGAIFPSINNSSSHLVEPDSDHLFATQPSRKYRKVSIPQEPSLNAEELMVLKSLGRSGLGSPEDDEDLDGFVESPLWEAKAESHFLPEEHVEDYSTNVAGSYYDNMLGNGDSYDSNFAYGSNLISDAEVLSALGYPQPPAQPSTSRPPVLCYCGCRMKASEAHKHRHDSVPKNGIFSLPGAVPLGHAGMLRRLSNAAMTDASYEEAFCMLTGKSQAENNLTMLSAPSNDNTNKITMTPMPNDGGTTSWDPALEPSPLRSSATLQPMLQTAPLQQGIPTSVMMPFQVPDAAPMARPRLYRPVMPGS